MAGPAVIWRSEQKEMSLASRSAASRSPAPPQPCKTKDPVRFQRQGVLPPLSPAPALQIAQRCDPAGWSGRQSASGRTALPTCCLLLAARRPLSRCPLPACTVADRSLSLAGRCGIRVSILPSPLSCLRPPWSFLSSVIVLPRALCLSSSKSVRVVPASLFSTPCLAIIIPRGAGAKKPPRNPWSGQNGKADGGRRTGGEGGGVFCRKSELPSH